MLIDTIDLICFSPTSTTRKVLLGIARGFPSAQTTITDLTPPEFMGLPPRPVTAGLAIIGAPVYAGRLPAEAVRRLRRLDGSGVPAILVTVYGNRAYEDALLELRDLAVETGFRPVAGAAFIGEHSFSTPATPIATGRPDPDDLKKAEALGQGVALMLRDIPSADEAPGLLVPGNFPHKDSMSWPPSAPILDASLCALCGTCVSVCPTGAIRLEEAVETDPGLCLHCCACVKVCPNGARTWEDERLLGAAKRLTTACADRKEPEAYVGRLERLRL